MQPLLPTSSGTGEWPTGAVVAEAQADPAWLPLPFKEFIVKLHGRCNLSCDYCYVYEKADQSWRGKPVSMSRQTIEFAAQRMREHLARADAPRVVDVTLHGGEPLLAGPALISFAASTFDAAATPATRVRMAMQTNGVLLDHPVLDVARLHNVRIGISLDGGEDAHNRHRQYANGRGSYREVADGIRALRRQPYVDLFGGILCTVDIANDPLSVYRDLLDFAPPSVDFLLPHATWDDPPVRPHTRSTTPYGEWLIAIFDEWYATSPTTTRIRLFDAIMSLVLGGVSRTEAVGLSPARMVVFETDGTYELADSLKVAFDGAPNTGLSIRDHSLDALMAHPSVIARQRGLASLAKDCLACPIRDTCGGGQYPHRYRSGGGFLNPSVYCPDLFLLITHIRDRVRADIDRLRSSVQ